VKRSTFFIGVAKANFYVGVAKANFYVGVAKANFYIGVAKATFPIGVLEKSLLNRVTLSVENVCQILLVHYEKRNLNFRPKI